MSLADSGSERIGFRTRCALAIRSIEDLRAEIRHAQSTTPPQPTATLLAEANFHLAEAIEEIRRCAARIAQI
jgi:hypothetical protein